MSAEEPYEVRKRRSLLRVIESMGNAQKIARINTEGVGGVNLSVCTSKSQNAENGSHCMMIII